MAYNHGLDRRHDINKGERLPERLTRVLDMENYWNRFQNVLDTESDEEFKKRMEEKKAAEAKSIEEKKAVIKDGDLIILNWAGVQVVKVDSVTDTGVKIGPHRYGWELVQKPSEAFMTALRAEVGDLI